MIQNDSDTFYQEVGLRIRDARNVAQVKQEVLATHLGLTRASVINLEKGRHHPSLFQLLKIAKFLMCEYTTLIPVSLPIHIDSHKLAIDVQNAVKSDPIDTDALTSAIKNLRSTR